MKTTLALLLSVAPLAAQMTLDPASAKETAVVKDAVTLYQSDIKKTEPRYAQIESKVKTEVAGLEYTVERYTHGKFGEGYVVNYWLVKEGKTFVKRENFGPAEYLGQDWTEVVPFKGEPK